MKKIRKVQSNHRGITVVELVITLAIAILIMGAIFSFFFYNNSLYNKGTQLSQVQFDVRMASQHVTKELRNVSKISTTDTSLPALINLASLKTKYPFVSGITFQLSKSGTNAMVSYIIQGEDNNGENHYQIETDVLLNNITSNLTGSNTVIYYQK